MAGKIGSYITSSIGTMRVTEQIDALEVMGVNSVNYLIFPKIVALMFYPFLVAIGMYLGILGGWVAGVYGGYSTSAEYIMGIQSDFKPFHVFYAFTKTYVFAFILATIPAYHGYYMKGGALEVGKACYHVFCLDQCSYYFGKLCYYSITFRIMIVAENVHKSFGDSHILKGISTVFEKENQT